MLIERFPLTELMSCNWRCLVHQASILSFHKLQDIYTASLTCIFMLQRGFHDCWEDFHILVHLHYFIGSTAGVSSVQVDQIFREAALSREVSSLLKLNYLHCSAPSAGLISKMNKCHTYIRCLYSADFECCSLDKKLEGW